MHAKAGDEVVLTPGSVVTTDHEGRGSSDDPQAAKELWENIIAELGGTPVGVQPTLQNVGNSGRITLLSSESYPQLHDQYVNNGAVEQVAAIARASLSSSKSKDLLRIQMS